MIRKSLLLSCLLLTYSVMAQPSPLTILHTNDLHSQFTPTEATWFRQNPKPQIGGMEALAATIQKNRDSNTLLLDAGDILTGTLISRMEYKGVEGGAFVEMMNFLDYDASVIGNHDFDNGRKTLEKLRALAEFDFLSSNLFLADSLFAPPPYQIYHRGGLNIGVIGLTIFPILGLVPSTSLDSVRSAPLAPIAQKWIDVIDPETDLIILLTHQGFDADSLLATQVRNADIIVGGHSHTRLDQPVEVNKMIIVQAGSRSRYLGKLKIMVDSDSIASYQGQLIPVWADSMTHESQIGQMVQNFSRQIDIAFGDTLTVFEHEYSTYGSDGTASPIGNLVTSAMLSEFGTDLAIMNTGGIRKALNAGPVTQKDIYECLPFINYMVEFECTGEQIATLINTFELARQTNDHESIQFSGLTYQSQPNDENGFSVSDIKVNGNTLDLAKSYKGVSIDYVVIENAKRYLGFEPRVIQKNNATTLAEFMIGYLKNLKCK